MKDIIYDILDNFDVTDSEKIIKVASEIKSHLKVNITQHYLEGKIESIKQADGEEKKKQMCKNLIPYLEWYIQGNSQ